MNNCQGETLTRTLRRDPLSLACLAGVGVSLVLMGLTIWLA